jgi:hypothetical protein
MPLDVVDNNTRSRAVKRSAFRMDKSNVGNVASLVNE